MMSTAPAATTPSSDMTSRSMPRRRMLGKLSSPAIDMSSARTMLASPTTLGVSTGSAPVAATQRLPTTATTAAAMSSRQVRRRLPTVWRARRPQLIAARSPARRRPRPLAVWRCGIVNASLSSTAKSRQRADHGRRRDANRRRWTASDAGELMREKVSARARLGGFLGEHLLRDPERRVGVGHAAVDRGLQQQLLDLVRRSARWCGRPAGASRAPRGGRGRPGR